MDTLSQGRIGSASTAVARSRVSSAITRGFACWPRAALPGVMLLASMHAVAFAQSPLIRVDTNICGEQPNASSRQASASGDGYLIAFTSGASNLVSSDTNGVDDVFIYDSTMNTTYLVSVSGTTQGNFGSDSPSIDRFGDKVAFCSAATNLVTGISGRQVLLWTRTSATTGTITLVSHSLAGLSFSGNGTSEGPAISADGRWIAFYSQASDLVTGDVNGKADAFVYDTSTGVISLVSLANGSSTIQGTLDSYLRDPKTSPDISVTRSDASGGPLVAFQSYASNLVPNDFNNARDVFVRDVVAATTTLVSVSTTGFSGNANSSGPDINQTGLFVAFLSDASDLITGDTNAWTDVFVHNLFTNTTTRVSVSSITNAQGVMPPSPAPAYEFMPMISYRGQYVSFDSDLVTLVTNQPVLKENVFLRDQFNNITTLMSINGSTNGGNDDSLGNTLAQDDFTSSGTLVSFQSAATDLIYFDLNGFVDVFTPGTPSSFSNYCFGDGSGTTCPCGNNGTVGQGGCNNLQNTGGAALHAYGNPSIFNDSLGLQADYLPSLPTSTFILFYQGPASLGPGTVFGDGLRCVGGTPTIRLGAKYASGSAAYSGCLGDTPIHTQGMITVPGTLYYQGWYRQAQMFCVGSTYNLTNGVTVVWGP